MAGWSALVLVAAVAVGEWAGWPFLRGPVEHWLSERLERPVQLADPDGDGEGARFRFVGSVRLSAPALRIAAPPWQTASKVDTLLATGVFLKLRYRDLWSAWRHGDIRVQAVSADTLDALLERRADGRATWQFGSKQPGDGAVEKSTSPELPVVGSLKVGKGTVHWIDPVMDADITAQVALASAEPNGGGATATPANGPVLSVTAKGRLRKLPLKLDLRANGALPLLSDETGASTLLRVEGNWGSSSLEFDGKALDVLRATEASGRFLLKGPSLAAVGDPFGVTLPSTGEFRAVGRMVRNGTKWQVVFDDATVGSSKLKGAFIFDAAEPVPKLSGRLSGARLLLADLAPSVGGSSTAPKRAGGRLLPDRHFDLPSLRVMRANVLIDVQEVDLSTDLLEPLRPLRGHLVLTDGVLRIEDIEARTAQGNLRGKMQLDGRQETAIWTTDLRWRGVELSEWIRQKRSKGSPPFISGKLEGSVQWTGKGQSTAQILGSLNGPMRFFLRDGRISHLAVEIAGIDLFQGLGLLIKGDEPLAVRCAAAETMASNGAIQAKVFVMDTVDSVAVVDGSVSLADETLDLRVVVTPKDFSLVSLRAPLLVGGKFADPSFSLEPASLAPKLAGAVLLGLINPLAALIPLIDPGNSDEAKAATAGCRELANRISNRTQPTRRVQKSK